jgi:hypothetical protein
MKQISRRAPLRTDEVSFNFDGSAQLGHKADGLDPEGFARTDAGALARHRHAAWVSLKARVRRAKRMDDLR